VLQTRTRSEDTLASQPQINVWVSTKEDLPIRDTWSRQPQLFAMTSEDTATDAATAAAIQAGDLGFDASTTSWLLELLDHCPCWNDLHGGDAATSSFSSKDWHYHRHLEDEGPGEALWTQIVVSGTLVVLLVTMMLDKVGPDWVMASSIVLFMACEIITAKEALAGFANEGVLTVMALFIVAEGVSRTGALDYYMGLILGTPTTVAGAQIRLTIPIAILSAFLNNTPIVVVMIPLTIRWAKKIGVPKQQLLIPLSYATILGGTCTLVGTSTNLVVAGLLTEKYPNNPELNIGLVDLAVYGVPNAMIGLAFMLACSPFLLPFGSSKGGGSENKASSGNTLGADALLFGARVKPWSPAAGRTYKRSGLGNSGGIFLTNVRRAATGNVHTAVSKDFVISVGDELYFTGIVELFGDFCETHGLEIITKDTLQSIPEEEEMDGKGYHDEEDMVAADSTVATEPLLLSPSSLSPSKMKLPANKEMERMRMIRLLSDQIGGRESVDTQTSRPATVVVSLDETEQAVLIGVDCLDRPGLLMDISDALLQQGLNLRHSEAKVFGERSLSVWGCEPKPEPDSNSSVQPDVEEIWEVVSSLLMTSNQAVVAKKKTTGTRVVQAIVTSSSSLIGRKPIDVEFRKTYMASIVAYQKNGKNCLLDVEMGAGDLLVLETMEGSPLLKKPPDGFYEKLQRSEQTEGLYDKLQRSVSRRSYSNASDESSSAAAVAAGADIESDLGLQRVWKDLRLLLDADRGVPKGEFLTAFIVTKKSPLLNKSLNDFGYAKLPGVVLISVERPNVLTNDTTAITAEDLLQVGDIFWYSGSADAIADLQKLHGLVFYHDEQLKEETAVELTQRRLVQAVVARGSPLVGQTVKSAHFRSRYGGVVIAIQRGSERVHELPARVKLQTGDVLLVEAGPNFVDKQGTDYRTFALVSEVENSSPPRPRLFLLCAALIVASLSVAGLEIRSLLVTAGIVGIVMVALGVVTQQEARDCLQWDLYVAIASAFGIAEAMENSGVAGGVATFLVNVGAWLGIGGEILWHALLEVKIWDSFPDALLFCFS
jgi:di/tricarboxylate transporter